MSYLLGAILSAGAGYAGMTVATMANARTTEAAKDGPGKALADRVPRRRRHGLLRRRPRARLGLMITYIWCS